MAGGRKGRINRVQNQVKGKVRQSENDENSPDLSKIARSLNKELECLSAEQVSAAVQVLESALKPLDVSTQKLVRESLSGVLQNKGTPQNVAKSATSWAEEVEIAEGIDDEDEVDDNDDAGDMSKSVSPWDTFDVSKLSSAGFKLHYIEPNECSGKKFGKIDHQDVQSELDYWNNAVIVYVLGAYPPYAIMNGFLRRIWAKYGVDKIVMGKNGMLLAHFESSIGRDEVLEAGIFHFDNKPLIVRPWSENIELNGVDVAKVPIWIKFPHLDVRYWSPICISKICSVIGHPIMVDKNTEEKTGISFVRALIEVDIGGQFPTEVLFQNLQGRLVSHEVVYEWKPTKCSFCGGIGHEEDKCKKKLPKKIWQPKAVTTYNTVKEKPNDEEWKTVPRRNTTKGQKGKSVLKETDVEITTNSYAVLDEETNLNDNAEIGDMGNANRIQHTLNVDYQRSEELLQPGMAEAEILHTPGDPPPQGHG